MKRSPDFLICLCGKEGLLTILWTLILAVQRSVLFTDLASRPLCHEVVNKYHTLYSNDRSVFRNCRLEIGRCVQVQTILFSK